MRYLTHCHCISVEDGEEDIHFYFLESILLSTGLSELKVEMADVPARFDGAGLILASLPPNEELPVPRAHPRASTFGRSFGSRSADGPCGAQSSIGGSRGYVEESNPTPLCLNPGMQELLIHNRSDASLDRWPSSRDEKVSTSAGVVVLGSPASTGPQGAGGEMIPLIVFAQNPGGSRRFLVSRSGHVYVARGLGVTGMVGASISYFIKKLLA